MENSAPLASLSPNLMCAFVVWGHKKAVLPPGIVSPSQSERRREKERGGKKEYDHLSVFIRTIVFPEVLLSRC